MYSEKRFCKYCGADQKTDGVCGENVAQTTRVVGVVLFNGGPLRFQDRHIFDPNGMGYCEYCGRNSISCECNDA